jgi:hypothetical protein
LEDGRRLAWRKKRIMRTKDDKERKMTNDDTTALVGRETAEYESYDNHRNPDHRSINFPT